MLLTFSMAYAGYYVGFRFFVYLTLRSIFAALTAPTIGSLSGPRVRCWPHSRSCKVSATTAPMHLGKMDRRDGRRADPERHHRGHAPLFGPTNRFVYQC